MKYYKFYILQFTFGNNFTGVIFQVRQGAIKCEMTNGKLMVRVK